MSSNLNFSEEYQSPVGKLLLTSDGCALTGLWIEEQKYFGATLDEAPEKYPLELFDKVKKWLDAYFSGVSKVIDFPLAPKGTEFRQVVWELLLEIPHGQTITYGDLAKKTAEKLGKEKMSAQAIGGAVGHNPISIIIPCHRVMGAGGNLTGYGGGIDKKIALLRIEKVDMTSFYIPKKGTAL